MRHLQQCPNCRVLLYLESFIGATCPRCSDDPKEPQPYSHPPLIHFPRERDLSSVVLSGQHVWKGDGRVRKWGTW